MAIFLKYGDVKGEATASTYKDWIEVQSFEYSVGRGISMGTGGGSKREATAPTCSEIRLTKTMDVADPLLLKEAYGGKAVDVKIEMTQTDNSGKHVAYQKYILNSTLISGYAISSNSDRPSISLSLNFAKIDSEYVNIDDKFSSKTTGHVIWDIGQSKLG